MCLRGAWFEFGSLYVCSYLSRVVVIVYVIVLHGFDLVGFVWFLWFCLLRLLLDSCGWV